MSSFAIAKDIEGDLKQIISEASLRRTIPHVKDRAERAVVSISAAMDKTSLDRAVEEVLSTLLIATEVGSVPKLILHSLSVLQKLAVSNVISSETFLHMITVLCKATSSVSGVLSGSQSSPSAAEVESAQLRCLQTLHLLQVDELASYFLNEIALSQVISMCTNLMNSATCSSVVSQAASAAVSQLIIFTTETTARIGKGTKSEAVLLLPPIFNAMGELNGLVSVLGGQSLLLLVHDLITMCAPDLTRHMFCQIFGSSRIRPQQALEILCDFFDPSSSPHLVEITGIDSVLTNYMIPVIAKYLTISEEQVTRETRLILRLFVKLCRNSSLFPKINSSLNKVFVQLNNFILDENLTPPKRIIFTETITCSIASNSWTTTVFSSLNYSSPSTLPLGGDSPVAKGANSQRDGASITESIIDSVCLFLHRSEFISESLVAGLAKLGIKTINEGTGSNGFTLLFSNADLSASASSGSSSSYNMMIIGVSLDLILSFIDVVSKNKDNDDGLFVKSCWTSLLSCLLLLVNNSGLADPSATVPGVLAGIEKLVFILAYADSREGVEACVASLLKVKKINKFLLNLFHRMSCDHTVLTTVSVDIWRSVIRQFEIIAFDSASSTGFNRPEDVLVQTIAMEAFFSMASSEAAVNKLVQALLPPFPCADWNSLSIVSPWTVSKLSQILRSESGLKCLPNIWTDKVGPSFTALRRIMNDFNLTQDLLLAGGRRNSASSTNGLSLCFSITECVAEIVKTCSFASPSMTHIILKSGVEFASLVPLKTVEAIHGIVESVGHLLDENGWKVIIDCLQLVAGDKTISAPLFKLIELIIGEHLSVEKQETGKLVRILHNLTISSHHQLAVTSSFKAISLVLKCSEQSTVTCSAWKQIHSFFVSAVLDQRAEVRNCAIRTLGAVAFTPLVVLEMAKSVIICAAEKFNEPAPVASDIVSGLIVHHSRDSEEKRWSESVVLVLQAVFSSFKAVSGPDDMQEFVDSEILAQVLDLCLFLPSSAQEEQAGWSDEVVVASVKFFVDIWRACTWIDAHVFLNVIRKEVDRNKQNTMSRSITLLLPALVPIMTETRQNSLSAIFHLFAVAITHPSLHLPNAVPYLARRPPSQTQGDYARETEAFKCVVVEALESGGGPIYKSTEESKKLIPFLSLLFSSINLPVSCFTDLVALLLDTDLIFRNSFTLAMAILTMEMGLKQKNRFNNNVMRSALCQIAQTRNGPVAIASTCLWKLAIQTLIILGNNDEQKQLSDLVVLLPLQQPADPIDYALFDFIAVQGDDDPELILYVKHQLELLAHQHDLFRMYILLSLLQTQREESSEEEVTFFSSARLICGNHDDVVNEETIAGLKKASNLTPNQFLPQLITCVSALFNRCDSLETAVVAVLKSNLPRALVKGSWESIASNLITTESVKIRTHLRALLLTLGTPDDIF